ncbi:MAG: cation:proton antiporter [Pseudomonadota bacterium]|nr:cation:proton antiporter [Pseudomonadota bacterium]
MPSAHLHLSDFIFNAVIVIALLIFTALVCHKLKLPSIVAFILSGVIIGPNGLGLIKSLPGANIISELAVVFLLFTIGLELSLQTLRKNWQLMVSAGLGQVFLTTVSFAALMHFVIGMDWLQALLWGGIVSLSSSAIVMKLLIDNRELNSSYGIATTGIMLSQDILIIPMTIGVSLLAATVAMENAPTFSYQGILILLGQFTLAGLMYFLSQRFIIPHVMEWIVKTKSRELFFFAVLFICLGYAVVFEKLNLSLALGAFIAGLLLSGSQFARQATSEIMLLRASFLALFFVSVGMLLDIRFVVSNIVYVLLFTLLTIIGKVSIAAFVAWLGRLPIRSALITGLFIAQIGELSFVLVNMGLEKKLISNEYFQYFLAVAIITMMLTPIVFRVAPRLILAGGSRRFDKTAKTSNLDVLIVGYGLTGQALADYLAAEGKNFNIVELNYNLVKMGKVKGYNIVYGDATMARVLYESGLTRAKIIVACVAGIDTTRSIVSNIMRWHPEAMLIVRVQYLMEARQMAGLVKGNMVVDAETLSAKRVVSKVKRILE